MVWKRLISTLSTVALSSVLLFNTAFGAVNWTKASYFQNSGGLNDNSSTLEIADGEATDIQNVVFDTGGAIKKRFGYTSIPSPAVQKVVSNATGVTGLSFFEKSDGSKYIVGIANVLGKATAFKKTYDTGGGIPSGAWDNIDYAGLPSNYTNDQLVTMNIAQDRVVMTMPATSPVKPFSWNGTGVVTDLTADADCPTSSLNAFHKNILFLSGNTTNPSRVYFSALGDITDYTVTDFFDVQTNDGGKVRGLVSAFDALYIFKDKSIFRLTGGDRDSFVLEKMVDNIGTLSNKSIAVLGNLIFFVTDQNDIALYDGQYTVTFLSQKIRNTIGGLNFSRATNVIGIGFSTYKYVDYDYYTSDSISGSATNNQVLMFDTQHKAWTKFSGINANAWTVADNSSGQHILVFGDYSGYVHFYPSTTYHDSDVSSAPIVSFYQTKWFRYPEVSLGDKHWMLLRTYALSETSGTQLNADCRSDYEVTGKIVNINLTQSGALWDTAKWDIDKWGGQSLLVDRKEINKGTNIFQIKYMNGELDKGFTIIGYENFIQPDDRI